jgi:hypothetical protein
MYRHFDHHPYWYAWYFAHGVGALCLNIGTYIGAHKYRSIYRSIYRTYIGTYIGTVHTWYAWYLAHVVKANCLKNPLRLEYLFFFVYIHITRTFGYISGQMYIHGSGGGWEGVKPRQ